MSLSAFRHAPVLVSGVCYGQHEVEVTLDAASCATQIAARVSARRVTRLWSSPLARCAGPARIVAARLGAPLVIDRRLLEIGFGAWEGRRWDAIAREDASAYAAWAEGWETHGPPGGESALALEARVRAWYSELGDEGEQVLVAHAGVMRALGVITEGLSWAEAMAEPVPHLEERRYILSRGRR
jgi:alpha-ribazole phosphatase